MTIESNLKSIRGSIRDAAAKAGRNPEEITLVAVSKRFPSSAIQEAMNAGQYTFGENYIQEAEEKISLLGNGATFHFIGHLQSNKAKTAARLFDYIETVDRVKLARNLNTHLGTLKKQIKILIQVNIGEDPQKYGVTVEDAEPLLRDIRQFDNLIPVGLMTMPPLTATPEESRVHFRELRLLSEQLAAKSLFSPNHKVELSMGMSGDYLVAIEEGATIIRIGTAIFGARTT